MHNSLPSARKILKNIPYSSTQQLVQLLLKGGSFDFLNYTPDIYIPIRDF